MSERQRIVVAGLAGLCLLASAAPAPARTWSDPVTIREPANPTGGMTLGFDARGFGVAAWPQSFGRRGRPHLAVVSRSPGGTWSPVRQGPMIDYPTATVARGGEVTLAGVAPHRSSDRGLPAVAEGTTLGSFRAAVPLASPFPGREVDEAVIAGNARGDAIVAWSRDRPESDDAGCPDCDDLFARVRRAGGTFGPRFVVARDEPLFDLQVAMGERGDAVVAWAGGGYHDNRVRARFLSARGRWSPADSTGADSLGNTHVELAAAVGPGGQALLAWTSSTTPEDIDARDYGEPVFMATRPAGGRLAAPTKLAEETAMITNVGPGRLDTTYTTRGTGLVAWTENDEGSPRVRSAVVRGDAVASTTTLAAGRGAEVLDLARGPRDDALVVWAGRSTSRGVFDPTIVSAALVRSGRFGPRHHVSPPSDRAYVGDAVAAFDSTRRATVIWARYGGRRNSGTTVRAASRAVP